jgi:hypothetical protein
VSPCFRKPFALPMCWFFTFVFVLISGYWRSRKNPLRFKTPEEYASVKDDRRFPCTQRHRCVAKHCCSFIHANIQADAPPESVGLDSIHRGMSFGQPLAAMPRGGNGLSQLGDGQENDPYDFDYDMNVGPGATGLSCQLWRADKCSVHQWFTCLNM